MAYSRAARTLVLGVNGAVGIKGVSVLMVVSRSIRLAFVAIVMALASHVNASVMWPTVEPPPQSKVAWIGKNMTLNGLPVQIQHFSSDLSQREVLDFYRARWGSASRRSQDLSDWEVIGTEYGNFSLKVQVRPANTRGSQGFMTVTMLSAKNSPAEPGGDFPRLGGSKVLTDFESMAEGNAAKLLILRNRFSVESNVSYYETAMPKQGWIRNTNYGGPQPGGRAYEMSFYRGDRELNIIINKMSQGTAITANIVTNNSDNQ